MIKWEDILQTVTFLSTFDEMEFLQSWSFEQKQDFQIVRNFTQFSSELLTDHFQAGRHRAQHKHRTTVHCTTEYFRAKLCSAYLKHSSYFWSTWWAASTPSTPSARGWTSTLWSATWSRSGCWEGWGPSSRGSTDVSCCLTVILTSSTKTAPRKGRIAERTRGWGQVWQFLSSICLLVFPVGN